jgi:hypothetical protein
MMKTIFQTLGLSLLIVLFLSIQISNRTIFDHVYSVISPVTKASQRSVEHFLAESFSSTTDYSKKLFDNSVPKVKDSVKSKMSASKSSGEPEEILTNKDRSELNDLIKKHR